MCLGLAFDAALPLRAMCDGLRLAGASVLAVSTREPLPAPDTVQSAGSTLACVTSKRPRASQETVMKGRNAHKHSIFYADNALKIAYCRAGWRIIPPGKAPSISLR